MGYFRLLRETKDLPNEITRELVMIANGLLDECMPGADKCLTDMIEETSEPEQISKHLPDPHKWPPCESCGAVALVDWTGERGRVEFEHRPSCIRAARGRTDPQAN
jgi:hypothetical protein